MIPKKGTIVPKKGTIVHPATRMGGPDTGYADAIAAALRQELGTTHQAVKTAMRWTGASNRTVRYWFAGSRGPSGEHLIALAHHSEVILGVFLQRAGRQHYAAALRLVNARDKLGELLGIVQAIINDETDS